MSATGGYHDHLGARVDLMPGLSPTYETIQETLSNQQHQHHSSCHCNSICRKQCCPEKLKLFASSLEKYRRTGESRGRKASYDTERLAWCLDVFGPKLPRAPHESGHYATSLDSARNRLQEGGCRFPESALLHAIVLIYEEKLDSWLRNKEHVRRFTNGQLWIMNKDSGEWVEASQCKQARHRWFPHLDHRKEKNSRGMNAGRTRDFDTGEAQVTQDNEGNHEIGSVANISLPVSPTSFCLPRDVTQVETHGRSVPTGSTSPSISSVSSFPCSEITLRPEGSPHTDHDGSEDPLSLCPSPCPSYFHPFDNEHSHGDEVENGAFFFRDTLQVKMHKPGKVDGPRTPSEAPATPSHIHSLSSSPGTVWDHSEGQATFGGFARQHILGQDAAYPHDNADPRFGTLGTQPPLLPIDKGNEGHNMHSLERRWPGNASDCNTWTTPDNNCQPFISCVDQDSEDLMLAPAQASNLHTTNCWQRQKRRHVNPEHGDTDFLEQRAIYRPETKSLKDIIKEVPELFHRLSGGKSLDDIRSEEGKQLRTDWVKDQVRTLVRKYRGFNVLVYKTGKFVEGPFGSVWAERKRYLPKGSEECLRLAMARCDDPKAAYKHVAPLVGCVTYHLAVFKSGSFQNFADEGEINWCFSGIVRRAREVHSFVEFF